MLHRIMHSVDPKHGSTPPDPAPATPLDAALGEAVGVLDRLLTETAEELAPHLYEPTIPLERLTGVTAVTLVADETVLREALRRVRAIRRAVALEAEDRANFLPPTLRAVALVPRPDIDRGASPPRRRRAEPDPEAPPRRPRRPLARTA
jgi:hypothetical protein